MCVYSASGDMVSVVMILLVISRPVGSGSPLYSCSGFQPRCIWKIRIHGLILGFVLGIWELGSLRRYIYIDRLALIFN